MVNSIKVIILVVIVCIFVILFTSTSEYLTTVPPSLSYKPATQTIQADPQFKDVILYKNDDFTTNDPNVDVFLLEDTGINKCIKDPKCKKCVEFGVSGSAFCYPN